MEGYIIRRVGSDARPDAAGEQAARKAIADRMESTQKPKFRLRYPPKDDTWGPERTQPETLDVGFKNIPDIGDKFQVTGSGKDDPIWAVIHTFTSLGSDVVRVALDQLGDEYTWATIGPNEFDCSGLVIFCYQKVGVSFPIHSADAIMKSDKVNRFSDRNKVRDGDLIGYHVGRLGAGMFDHIGIACWRDRKLMVIDASSSADRVVFRDADSNPISSFGYVPAVTGKH